MKNLENYGVQNLNAEEKTFINGGIPLDFHRPKGTEVTKAPWIDPLVDTLVDAWDFCKGFADGFMGD